MLHLQFVATSLSLRLGLIQDAHDVDSDTFSELNLDKT